MKEKHVIKKKAHHFYVSVLSHIIIFDRNIMNNKIWFYIQISLFFKKQPKTKKLNKYLI